MTNDNNFELQEIIVENFHLDAPVEIENGILYLNKSTREVSLMLKLNLLSAEISEISSVTCVLMSKNLPL
jgi:hypothetical protein